MLTTKTVSSISVKTPLLEQHKCDKKITFKKLSGVTEIYDNILIVQDNSTDKDYNIILHDKKENKIINKLLLKCWSPYYFVFNGKYIFIEFHKDKMTLVTLYPKYEKLTNEICSYYDPNQGNTMSMFIINEKLIISVNKEFYSNGVTSYIRGVYIYDKDMKMEKYLVDYYVICCCNSKILILQKGDMKYYYDVMNAKFIDSGYYYDWHNIETSEMIEYDSTKETLIIKQVIEDTKYKCLECKKIINTKIICNPCGHSKLCDSCISVYKEELLKEGHNVKCEVCHSNIISFIEIRDE